MSEPYNIEDQYVMNVFNKFPRLRQWSEGMTMIDVYRQLLSIYPLGSKAWIKFREIHVDFLRSTCENEYVLCLPKQKIYPYRKDFDFYSHFGEFDNVMSEMANEFNYEFKYVPRFRAEWNPTMVHFVVGGIVHTADDLYVVVQRLSKNWIDKYTPIMGHVAYGPDVEGLTYSTFYNDLSDIDTHRFIYLLAKNLIRELREEICYPGDESDIDISKWRYEAPRFIGPTDIQYYHAGFLFMVNSKAKASEFKSGEPEKNQVALFTKDQLTALTYNETDGWLYNAIQKFL